MPLLTTEAEIRAAIAMLNPVARDAAQIHAREYLREPEAYQSADACGELYLRACSIAMTNHWGDPETISADRIRRFHEDHSEAIWNLSASIVQYVNRAQEHEKKKGWLGKAAAFAGGAILAGLFG